MLVVVGGEWSEVQEGENICMHIADSFQIKKCYDVHI